MANAKKNLVFLFGCGRHASFPQKPIVKTKPTQLEDAAIKVIKYNVEFLNTHDYQTVNYKDYFYISDVALKEKIEAWKLQKQNKHK